MASLVIQTSFLGDMVLTTPLLVRLAQRGPVDVVATPLAAPLLANHPAVRDVIVYDKRGVASGVRGLLRTARALRTRPTGEPRGATVAYLAQGSLRSATLARLAGIHERVGFDTSAGRRFYTRTVPFDRSLHHAERLWRLANVDDEAPVAPLHPRLYPSPNDHAAAASLLQSAGVAPGAPMIVLAPGSVWATKRWPHFRSLAIALATDPRTSRARQVIMGGSGDSGLAREIADGVQTVGAPLPIDATGRLPGAIVTNDSLPLHLASAVGTPTVALFGPTTPELGFGPLTPSAEVLGVADLACRPCHAHGPNACPLGHWRCMEELSVARVIDAVIDIMRFTR
ncbi:MAG: glycosyltransferase family 9 protein [Gemmatimonadaceae bacterium]|nr:glycosyltransferase family 9 protein [Gemmatimonadaceae bacterium]